MLLETEAPKNIDVLTPLGPVDLCSRVGANSIVTVPPHPPQRSNTDPKVCNLLTLGIHFPIKGPSPKQLEK